MESKDELKEINIKNCAGYYFDEIIRLYKEKYEKILVYDI